MDYLRCLILENLLKKERLPPALGKKNKKTTRDHTPPLTLQKI